MRDEELKKIIQSDKSTPQPPKGEWENIQKTMNKKHAPFIRLKRVGIALNLSIFLLIGFNYFNEQNKTISDEVLVQYLFEEDLTDSDPLYSFID